MEGTLVYLAEDVCYPRFEVRMTRVRYGGRLNQAAQKYYQ